MESEKMDKYTITSDPNFIKMCAVLSTAQNKEDFIEKAIVELLDKIFAIVEKLFDNKGILRDNVSENVFAYYLNENSGKEDSLAFSPEAISPAVDTMKSKGVCNELSLQESDIVTPVYNIVKAFDINKFSYTEEDLNKFYEFLEFIAKNANAFDFGAILPKLCINYVNFIFDYLSQNDLINYLKDPIIPSIKNFLFFKNDFSYQDLEKLVSKKEIESREELKDFISKTPFKNEGDEFWKSFLKVLSSDNTVLYIEKVLDKVPVEEETLKKYLG